MSAPDSGPPSGGPPPGWQPPGWQPPPPGWQPPPPGYPPFGHPQPPLHAGAQTAQILGLVALAGIVFCSGITLVLSPVAWFLGKRARDEIDAAPPGQWRGRDEAQLGYVTGLVGSALLGLALLAAVVGLGLLIAFSA